MSHNIWRRWVSRLFKLNPMKRLRKQRRTNLRVEPLEDRVVPTTDTWTGLGTGLTARDWSNTANWLGRVPVSGDTVVFPTITNGNLSPIYNLTTNPALNSISINGAGYSLSGQGSGVLIVTNGITVGAGANPTTLAQTIELLPPPAAPQENIEVDSGSVLTLTNPIIAAASTTISKTGVGTLILSAASPNWLGSFTLGNAGSPAGGIVEIENQQALGSTAVTINTDTQIQVASGATGKFAVPNHLLINGSGLVGDGALLNVSGNNAWTGAVQMDSNTTFGAAAGSALTIGIEGSPGDTNAIGDNGSGYGLTKEGAGTLILPNADTYRGTTTINNGILEIENPLSLGAGANALDTQQSGKPTSETIVNYNPTNNEAGTLEINYSSTDIITSDPNALVGSLFQYYQNGSLATASKSNPTSIDGFQVYNDILIMNGPGFNGLGALYNAVGDNEWDGSIILGSPPPALANPFINNAPNTQLLVSGIISDPNQVSTLNKIGTGELIFNNANTYQSVTHIDAGILDIADSTALGTGTVTVSYAAALQLDVDQGVDGTTTTSNGIITGLRSHGRNLGFDSMNGSGLAQELDISITGTSGSFTLGLNGKTVTIPDITVSNLASVIQTQINNLLTAAGFTGDSVAYVVQDGTIYRAIFAGPNTNLPQISVTKTTGTASVVVNPIADPTQELQITGTGGSFTLSLGGLSTTVANITSNTLPSQIQTAMDTLLTNAGYSGETVSYVSQDGNVYRIFFTGPYTDIPLTAVTATTGSASVVASPDYGLTVANPLIAQGPGFATGPDSGALDSHTGINTYTGTIDLVDSSATTANPTIQRATAIGVEVDNRTGHTLADNNYLQWDYSLTVEGLVSGGDLIKSGLGNMILPNDNNYGDDYDNTGAFIDTPLKDNVNGMTWNNGVVTVITETPDHFIVGDFVQISEMTPLGYNGTFTITSIINAREFTFNLAINPGAGTYLLPDPLSPLPYVRLLPSVIDPTTEIQLGWITIDNNQSLGSTYSALGQNFSPAQLPPDFLPSGEIGQLVTSYPVYFPQTLEPYVWVDNGGALHLDPLPGQPNLDLYNNFLLSGNGLTSQNYGLIEQAGAIENLNGDNTLPGIIQLNGNAGVGVEQIPPTGPQTPAVNPNPPDIGFPPLLSNSPPLTASQLTLTGNLENYFNPLTGATVVGGITKLGSRRLIIEGAGSYTGNVFISNGVLLDQNDTGLGAYNSLATVTVANGAALEFGNSVNQQELGSGSSTPSITATENGGVQNGVEVWDETLKLYGPGDSTYSDSALSVLASNGTTTGPTVYTVTVTGSPLGDYFLSFNGLTTGPIAASATAAQVQSALSSILAAGQSVTVVQNSNVYLVTFGGSLINTNLPLLVDNMFSTTSGTATIPVVTSGNYTLTFNGQTTAQLSANSTVAQVMNAFNALTSVNGLASFALNAAKTAFTITFGGALATTNLPIQIFTGTFPFVENTQIGTTTSQLAPVFDPIVASDAIWRGPVVLGNSTTITVDTNSTLPANQTASRLILTGNVSDVYKSMTLTISPIATGTFTLNYTGPNAAGTVVTDPTGSLNFTSKTLTADIQNALNSLANIGGVGGNVTVMQSAPGVYTITFAGVFTSKPVSTLSTSSVYVNITGVPSTPSDLTIVGGGEVDLDGNNTYYGTTYVQQGKVSIGNQSALGNSGVPEIQSMTLSGLTTGSAFTLDFPGYGYASSGLTLPGVPSALDLTAKITYTGNVATDETNIQNALEAALSTSGTETDAAGTVSVVETITAGTPTLTFTFGGSLSGFPLALLSAAVLSPPASPVVPPVSATEVQQGAGGTLVENGSSLEVAGSFTVSGESLILEGNGTVQDVQSATLTGGSTGSFRLGFIGPDTLAGVNVTAYTGQITVPTLNAANLPAFLLTIQNALDALPNIGGVGGNTTVTGQLIAGNSVVLSIAFGGSLSGQNLQKLITDGSALVGGTIGPATTTTAGSQTLANVPTQWFQTGPFATSNGQNVGNTQVSGQITSEAVNQHDPNVIYVGTAGGGVWKTIDGGISWHPVFDAIPDVQILQLSYGATGSFQLNFTGPNAAGTVVTDTTISLNPASTSLPLDIQAALDSLPNIGGVGGQVTVTQYFNSAQNVYYYMVTFNGSLAGRALNLMTANTGALNGTITPIEFEAGQGVSTTSSSSPALGIYVGAVTINPDNSQIIYVGTGVLTNNDGYGGGFAGTGVYESLDGGLTWSLMLDNISTPGATNPVTGTSLVNPFFGMGVSGIAVEPSLLPDAPPGTIPPYPASQDTIFVTDGVVASTYPGPVTPTPPLISGYGYPFGVEYGFGNGVPNGGTVSAAYPNGDALVGQLAAPVSDLVITVVGPLVGGTLPDEPTVPNANGNILANGTLGGTGQLAGVWRFSPTPGTPSLGQWVNITDITSTARDTLDGQSATPPGSPGPNDDFRVGFPEEGDVRWTDVKVLPNTIETFSTALGEYVYVNEWTVYAALGSPGYNEDQNPSPSQFNPAGPWTDGGVNGANGVFWGDGNGNWWLGTEQIPQDQVETLTLTDPSDTLGKFSLEFNGVWTGESLTGGFNSIPIPPYDPNNQNVGAYANAIAAALNNLSTIGGLAVPGVMVVTATSNAGQTETYNITFEGGLSDSPQSLFLSFPPPSGGLSKGANGSVALAITTQGGGFDNEPGNEFPTWISYYDGDVLGIGNSNTYTPKIPDNGYITISGAWTYEALPPLPDGETGSEFPLGPDDALAGFDDEVYASVGNSQNGQLEGIFKTEGTAAPYTEFWSTNGTGFAWTNIGDPATGLNDMNGEGNYDNAIVVDPNNFNIVWIGGGTAFSANGMLTNPTSMIFTSTDGGTTWTDITGGGAGSNGDTPHNSVHALAVDGNNVIAGTDGGIWSLNGVTNNWDDLNSDLAIAQVNGASAAQTNVNEMVVGTEGNGLAYFNGLSSWIESNQNGEPVGSPGNFDGAGLSGGLVYVDPANFDIVYAVLTNSFGGGQDPLTPLISNGSSVFLESTDAGKTWFQITSLPVSVNPNMMPGSIFTTGGSPYFPFLIDPLNPNRLVVGGQDGLFQSLNGGASWQNLQLLDRPLGITAFDPTAVAVAGYQGVFVADPGFPEVKDTGAQVDDPSTIYSAAYYVDPNTGQIVQGLFVTKDLGLDWLIRTPTGMTGTIQSITVNPANRDNVFVITQGPAGLGENQIFESTDAGQTWTVIGGAGSAISGLADIPLWQLAVDPRNGNLFIGADDGVYELTNAVPLTPDGVAAIPTGGAWARFGTGMPDVSVHTLNLNLSTNTLLAGTYGRGVYQLFLDAPETATDPLYVNGKETIVGPASGALISLSGTSFWSGPVALVGDSATNTVTIGSDGTQGLPDGITAASLNFAGQISDANPGSNVALDKVGNGDVVFSGPNIYGGSTTIQAGNLVADNNTALGLPGPNSGTTVETGAALDLIDNLDSEQVTLNGNGFTFNGHYLGSLVNISGNNTFTGPITVNNPAADATVQSVTIGSESGSTLTLMGTISGGGVGFTMVKEDTGTVVLDDSNTYTGTAIVYQGALEAENSNAFSFATEPTNRVEQLDGAQVQLSGTEDVQTLTQTATGGTFALSFTGPDDTGASKTDTTNLMPLSVTSTTLAGDIQSSLNALANIGGVGGNVTVSEAPYQSIEIPAAATGTFTLSFTGPDSTGKTVTDLTSVLSIVPAYGTLALDIQNALDQLANIGGIGASVTVVQQAPGLFAVTFGGNYTGQYIPLLGVDNTSVSNGPITVANTFTVAFGGTLIGEDLNTLVVNNLSLKNGNIAPQTTQAGTQIAVANPLAITGTGGNTLAAVQDVQTIVVSATRGSFELNFTGPNASGIVETDTTPALSANSSSLATDIQTALNKLTNIQDLGGSVTVLQTEPGVYTVTFGGTLSGVDVNTLTVTNLTLSGGTVVAGTTQAGSPQIVNAGALLDIGGSNTWSGPIQLQILPGFMPYTLNAGTVAIGATASETLTVSGQITEQASSAPGIPNALLPLGVEKVDAGTVALSNANHYTGSTEVAQGILDVQNASALGDRTTGSPATGMPTIEQIVTLSDSGPSGSAAGHFTLTFNGKTAATTLNFGASAAEVQNVLKKMDGMFASGGTVQVYETPLQTTTENQPTTFPSKFANGIVYTFIFGGTMGQTPLQVNAVGNLGTTAYSSVVAAGGVDVLVDSNSNGTGEVALSDTSAAQTGLTVSRYTLTINGFGPSGSPGSSNSGATGNGALYNAIGNNSWTGPLILTSNSSVGVSPGNNALQEVTIPGSNIPGTTTPFTLGFTYDGTTSSTTQPADVGAANLQAALNGLLSIQEAGGVTVGQSGDNYYVVFNGSSSNIPPMTLTTNIINASLSASIDSSLHLTNVISTQTVDNQQASQSTEPILDKVAPGTLIFPAGATYIGQTVYAFNTQDVLTDEGRTIISNGNVQVDATGMGTIFLGGGTVGGNGSVANIVNETTAASGGTIDPGDNYPTESYGLLTSTGNVTLNTNDTVYVDLQLPASTTNPPSGPTNNDVLNVQGTLTLGGATLTGLVNTNVGIGDSYTIINDPSGQISGVFNGASIPTLQAQEKNQPGLYAATVTYIGGVKFEVDYFPTHVDVFRELVTETMTLVPSLPSAGNDVWPVYGQDEQFIATLTSTDPVTATSAPPAATGTVVFTVAAPSNLLTTGTNLTVSNSVANAVAPAAPDNYIPTIADIGDILVITGGAGFTQAAYQIVNVVGGQWILNASPASLGTAGGHWSLSTSTNYDVTLPTNPATGIAVLDLPAALDVPLQSGTYTVMASFNGYDANNNDTFNPIVDAQMTVPPAPPVSPEPPASSIEVVPAGTTTLLNLNYPLPGVYGENFSLVASVSTTASPTVANTLAPAGTVTFYDNNLSNPLQTVTLNSPPPGVTTSTATLNSSSLVNLLGPGNHVIIAVYNPAPLPAAQNYLTSSSNENVAVHQATTSITVTTPAVPTPVYGQAGITFNAKVTPEEGGDPSGLVTFIDNSQVIGTGTLSTTAVSNGTNLTVSNTNAKTVTPDGYTPTVADIGDIVQVTNGLGWVLGGYQVVGVSGGAWVLNGSPASAGSTGGQWTLYETTASYTTTAGQLQTGGPGTNPPTSPTTITARYGGDSNFIGSSNSLSEAVNQAQSSVSLASSSPVVSGVSTSSFSQSVTFTATVSAVSPGNGNATGNVIFYDNGSQIGVGQLSTVNGVTTATFTTTSLQVGADQQITADYLGDTNFDPNNSATLLQTVTKATATTTVTTSGASVYGQPVTLTATVTPPTGGPIPTGTVNFYLQVSGVNLTVSNTNATAVTPDGYLPTASDIGQTLNITGGTGWTVGSYTIVSVVSGQWVLNASPAALGTAGGQWTLNEALGTGSLGTSGGVTSASYTTTVGQLPVPISPNTADTIVATYGGNGNYSPSTGTTTQLVSKDNTTTVVSSSGPVEPPTTGNPNPSATIYAQIIANAPGAGNPVNGETVSFATSGGTPLGTGTITTTNGVSVAQITVTWSELGTDFSIGNNSIVATYAGDSNLNGSQGTYNEVYQDLTTTSVSTSPTTSVFGQSVTVTAVITPAPTNPASSLAVSPTGTVTFLLGTTVLGTATVGSPGGGQPGLAVLPVTSLPVGTNETITAIYSGDTTFIGSSATTSQTVNKDTTSTALTSTATTIRAGQVVILTAAVNPVSPGQGVPTGTVTFYRGSTKLATVTLVNGVASLQTALSAVGTETITAKYSGDGNDLPSSGTLLIVCQAVGTRTDKTTVTSSLNPSIFGQAVTFTATVTDLGAGAAHTPSGVVSFFENSVLMGYGTLSGSGRVSTATFSTSTLPQGTDNIVAVFNGSNVFAASATAKLVQTVNAVPTRTSNITLAESSVNTTYGTPVTFTATVTDTGSGLAQTPTGKVTFFGTTSTGAVITMGTGTLTGANGIATAMISFGALPVGVETITATYSGDGAFASESNITNNPAVTHTVTIGSSALALSSSAPNGSTFGQAVTFTAIVTIPGSNVVPQGAVEFQLGQVVLGFVSMTNGVATFTTSTLPVGTNEITATFTGSPNLKPSTPSTIDQEVSQGASKIVLTSSTTSNSPVTMTATVSGASPGSVTPTGSVTFYIDGNQVGTSGVNSSGVATFVYNPGVSTGKHTLEAVYSGDLDYMGNSVTEIVNFIVGRGT